MTAITINPPPNLIMSSQYHNNHSCNHHTQGGKKEYLTSGNNLLIQFKSSIGSLDGSSIDFLFEVKRVQQEPKLSASELSANCSQTITSSSTTASSFILHPSSFNHTIDGPITCTIKFDASSLLHGRVKVQVSSAFNSELICGKHCDFSVIRGSTQAKLTIHSNYHHLNYDETLCYCEPHPNNIPTFSFQPLNNLPTIIKSVSNGSSLTIKIHLPFDWGTRRRSIPIQVNLHD